MTNEQRKIEKTDLRSGERTVKNKLEDLTHYQLYRYISAFKYISSTDIVADVGCGVGYGSFLIAKKAKEVIGIDDSQEAIEYANNNWKCDNVKYVCENALNVKTKFDCVITHEVIEHVRDVESLFNVLGNITKKYLIFTVPSPKQRKRNKFHWKHYHPDEIKEYLKKNGFNLIRFDGMYLPFYVAKKEK